jgi:hypothetical protein
MCPVDNNLERCESTGTVCVGFGRERFLVCVHHASHLDEALTVRVEGGFIGYGPGVLQLMQQTELFAA